MRILPVLDLKGGIVVHGRGGDRARYQPLRSPYAPDVPAPRPVAAALCAAFALSECYVADLDAIAGCGDHLAAVGAIAADGIDVWLDAGVRDGADMRRCLDAGAARVIVATETLERLADLERLAGAAGPGRVAASVDLRGGRVVSACPELSGAGPAAAAAWFAAAGVLDCIVLELTRVGSGLGPDLETIGALAGAAASPPPNGVAVAPMRWYVGGGVRDAADLRAAAAAGAAGALVATALHGGSIRPADLKGCRA